MRAIIFAIFMLVLLGTPVACNTIHGLGHDISFVIGLLLDSNR
jgi:predicted small secreted protein